ncbi:ABC transporter substrate-binding protein [Planobispora rosea]|uniref:ABC transporter substrate-binding protein n=1 Tax=Planobispora rosea TaxID=35762 RepID=A0A8J3WB74_PLARO|nr:ABC transporter permease [Planobispora rosea]GGS53603.1 ABC transporter substrate-binding protein [Planobispora rosea]GIH82638.1 ABC transporter substrate-binding protein [Planobispora rosea]
MWLIARRTLASGWAGLLATLLAMLLSVGLMSGALHFALRAQAAAIGSDAAEYARADVIVRAAADGRPGIEIARLASVPGVAAVAGDASVPVTVVGTGGAPVTAPAGGTTSLRPWITDPRLNAYHLVSGRAPAGDGEIVVLRHVAEAGDLAAGSTATLLLAEGTRTVTVVGVATVEGLGTVATGDVVLAAPETVRRAAGLPEGRWQALWVKAAPGTGAATLRDGLRSRPGAEAVTVLTSAAVRREQSGELAAMGFSLGGTVGMLAVIAMFVGMFVVSGTFGALVRQRTRTLALLAAIGARPRQIRRLIRLEALAVGVVAAAGGVPAGYGVSHVLTWLLARDGYDVSAGETPLGWIAVAVPFVLGVATAWFAAGRAARRAAGVAPVEALRATAVDAPGGPRRIRGALGVLALSGVGFGPAVAVAFDEPPGADRTVGIVVLVLIGVMIAFSALAMLTPLFVGPLGGLVGRLAVLAGGEPGRLARAAIVRNPTRVASAAGTLMLGVMMVASTGALSSSVQERFRQAGDATVRAEYVIAGDGGVPLPGDAAALAARVPGVTAAVGLTGTGAELLPGPGPEGWKGPERREEPSEGEDPDEAEPVVLEVTGAAQVGAVLRLGGRPWEPRPGRIALTSSVMEANGIRTGQRITLRGPSGEAALIVAHRYHDPSHMVADQALVHPSEMARLDARAPTTAVLVRGAASAAVLERALAAVPAVRVHDRDSYVRAAAASQVRGLGLLYGFIAMALLISLSGMATTVFLGVTERTREFGMLGAVGVTARQIRSIVRWEAVTVVLLGLLLGLGAAAGTMALLRGLTGSSFIRVAMPPWLLVLVAGGAVAIVLVTTAMPARRAAAVPVLEATRM